MKTYYHGTSKENALKILKSGYFRENTYYARQSKHAVKFGGNYVFGIKVNFPKENPLGWQIIASNKILTNRIVSLRIIED